MSQCSEVIDSYVYLHFYATTQSLRASSFELASFVMTVFDILYLQILKVIMQKVMNIYDFFFNFATAIYMYFFACFSLSCFN